MRPMDAYPLDMAEKLRMVSLFTGYGGLDMGVSRALDGNVETIAVSDVEPGPLLVEAYRYPHVRQLGDVTQADWDALGRVDVVCGGFPCQSVSLAGQRAGLRDGTATGLWYAYRDAIGRLHPRLVIGENVTGLASADSESAHHGADETGRPAMRALGRVLGDLADLGYDAIWLRVEAADIGAPHHRARLFITAFPHDPDRPLHVRTHPYAIWDGNEDVWTTGKGTLFGGPDIHRDNWPVNGILHNGAAYPLNDAPASDGHVEARLLPTPKASDPEAEKSTRPNRGPDGSTALGGQVSRLTDPRHRVSDSMFLPTPRSNDVKGWNQRRNQENLHGAVMLGVRLSSATLASGPEDTGRADGGTDWGRFTPAIRHWEKTMNRPAPDPVQATGLLRHRIANHTIRPLTDPRWLLHHAVRRYGPPLIDQPERDRMIRRWQTTGDGHDLIDPAVWDPNTLEDGDTPITGRSIPGRMVTGYWSDMLGLDRHGLTPPIRHLSPRFVEWMMGLPDGWVTDPNIWRNQPGNHRNMQLRLLGNGVVPAQAELAVRRALTIRERLTGDA